MKRFYLALLPFSTLAACAAPSEYMGVDLTQPAPPLVVNENAREVILQVDAYNCATERYADGPVCSALIAELEEWIATPEGRAATDVTILPLVTLARRAQAGNLYAAYELGIRYEEGRGVEQDLDRAESLYRIALGWRDGGGPGQALYSAADESPFAAAFVSMSNRFPRVEQAEERLRALEARRAGTST